MSTPRTTGADTLVQTLIAAGVDTCFTNPGTTEVFTVAALEKFDGMRPVLTLFEGVATGAADGYARMAGKPACTLLHVGPGLMNGIANFHNAQKAHTPLINLVGDHATYHRKNDPPLAADLEAYARPFSGWLKTAASAEGLAQDAADAVFAATAPPGQIATLIVPSDCAWGPAHKVANPQPAPKRELIDKSRILDAARALTSARHPTILMSGQALGEKGLDAAGRVASATGAHLFCDTFNARIQRGAGRVPVEALPYFPETAIGTLAQTDVLVVVGTKAPVGFFAYPDTPGMYAPDECLVLTLAGPGHDAAAGLDALAEEVAPGARAVPAELKKPDLPQGKLTADKVCRIVAHFMPEDAIVVDEMITSGLNAGPVTATSAPHDWLQLTGGAIGSGLPLAAGACVACPDRKVICLQADGSAMYTVQALWTYARENLDVTAVIFSNRSYEVLKFEFGRFGFADPGEKALSMFDLANPELNWCKLASGLGVAAVCATTAEEFSDHFSRCITEPGPRLIEAVI